MSKKDILDEVYELVEEYPDIEAKEVAEELGISEEEAGEYLDKINSPAMSAFNSFICQTLINKTSEHSKDSAASQTPSAIKESMDDLCEVLEDEIIGSELNDDIKKKMLARLRKFSNTETNIMLVGATGSGKSSTINALFSVGMGNDDFIYKEVAKVGTKADPETKVIEKYKIGNLVLWDTPGLGDSTEDDKKYSKLIKDLLEEHDDHGNELIDLVVNILDGSSKDLGTSYKILNEVILPHFSDDTERVLVAVNQADIAMKTGRHWDYENNTPDEVLTNYLEDKVLSVKDRIYEDTSLEVDPIYYCAGYKDDRTGDTVRPYNLSKFLLYIMNAIPPVKRVAVIEGINLDSDNFEYNDDDSYNIMVKNSFFSSFGFIMEESVEKGAEIGLGILGFPGALVGGTIGAAVGAVRGLIGKIFG